MIDELEVIVLPANLECRPDDDSPTSNTSEEDSPGFQGTKWLPPSLIDHQPGLLVPPPLCPTSLPPALWPISPEPSFVGRPVSVAAGLETQVATPPTPGNSVNVSASASPVTPPQIPFSRSVLTMTRLQSSALVSMESSYSRQETGIESASPDPGCSSPGSSDTI